MANDNALKVNSTVNGNITLPLTSAESILNRLKEAASASSDGQLAKLLEINRQNIGAARKRDEVPTGWIFTISDKTGYSADWIRYGEGPKMRAARESALGEGSQSPVDTNILGQLIEAVEEALEVRKLKAEPDKKAEFIAFLYEYFTETGKEVSKETVERHLRLVA